MMTRFKEYGPDKLSGSSSDGIQQEVNIAENSKGQ